MSMRVCTLKMMHMVRAKTLLGIIKENPLFSNHLSLLVEQVLIGTSTGQQFLLLSCLVKFAIFIEIINNSSMCKKLTKFYSCLSMQRRLE